jgi:betaine-aldehyde dehydrogenase
MSMESEFAELLVKRTRNNVRMGPGMESNVNFGPLATKAHLEKVRSYIEHGKHVDKAKLLYNGATASQSVSAFADTELAQGYWCPPVIFADCKDSMKICAEEIFGPVLCILTYDDSDPDYLTKLLARANNTNLGLAAGVFTQNLNLAHSIIARLQAGITWINTWGESPAEMSVGGWKMSGVGVENGRRALNHWTQNKSTLVDMSGSIASAFEAPVKAKL